jgi:hypothetical protein
VAGTSNAIDVAIARRIFIEQTPLGFVLQTGVCISTAGSQMSVFVNECVDKLVADDCRWP